MISAIEEQGFNDIIDEREHANSNILTEAERKTQYRAALKKAQGSRALRLKDFAQGKRRHLRTVDLIPRRKRAEDTDLICRYYNGDQYGKYNELGIYEDNRQDGDFAYAIPVLAGHVEQAFIQLLKVKPHYEFNPDDKDDATMGLVAKMCEDLGTKELARVMNPKVQSELYNLLLSGESHRIVGWAPNAISPKTVKRPKYETIETEIPGRRECESCKTTVPDDTAAMSPTQVMIGPSCPKCGSTNVRDIPPGMTRIRNQVGTEDVALGENVLYIPHMLSIQRDMSAIEPEDSTFVVEYGYVDKHVAEWTYQSQIEPSTLPMPVEMQLRYDLERSSTQIDAYIGTSRLISPMRGGVTAVGNSLQSAPNRKQPHERYFLDAAEYGQFYCTVDEQLPNGKVIPKDTILGDYFPDGILILFVGDTIMDFRPYVRRRKMSVLRYGRIAGTNSGAGLKKGLPLQDALNDNFNLNQTVKHTVGHPLTVINGRMIDKLPGAGNVLKVMKNVDDVNKVVAQFPGQALNNSDGIDQLIEGALQFILGTNTVGGSSIAGAPDMRAAGTATGIAAMQEQASARQSGPVDQRTQCDMETLVQILENIQEFSTDEQKTVLIKRYGSDVCKRFFECKIRHEMTVSIKTGTDMPRSQALDQANYIAFGQVASTILPVAQDYPWVMEFLGDLATSMGFPFNVGQGRNDRREGQYRLNLILDIEVALMQSEPQLKNDAVSFAARIHDELSKVVEPLISVGDPSEQDPTQPPSEAGAPRVLMQDHDTFMDVYKDAIFSEQAKGWSQAHRLVVIQLFLDHYKAKASQKFVEAQIMAQIEATLAPPAPPEAPDNSPTAADEAALEEQKFRQEAQLRGAEHESERQHKDEDLHRGIIDRNHETASEMALASHQAAVAPKPAPAASA